VHPARLLRAQRVQRPGVALGVVDDPARKARVAEVYRDVLVPRVRQMLAVKESQATPPGPRISGRSWAGRPARGRARAGHPLLRREGRAGPVPDPDPRAGTARLSTHMDSGMSRRSSRRSGASSSRCTREPGSALTTAHQLRQPTSPRSSVCPWTVPGALIPVAYTTGGDFGPSPRKPVEEVIVWNGLEEG